MSAIYKLNSEDSLILAKVEQLIQQAAAPGMVRPAQLVTLAKLLHVLQTLPETTESVAASVSISCQLQGDIGGSATHIWNFSVRDECLSLSTACSEYDPEGGHEYYTVMEWSIVPGSASRSVDVWDEFWMTPSFSYNPIPNPDTFHKPGEVAIIVEDDDNSLLNG